MKKLFMLSLPVAVAVLVGLMVSVAQAQVVDGQAPNLQPQAGAAAVPGGPPGMPAPGAAPARAQGQQGIPGMGGPQRRPGAGNGQDGGQGREADRMRYMMQMMQQRQSVPAIAVAEGFVFVVFGNTLYQFTVDGLQQVAKADLTPERVMPQRPGGPGGAGGPGRPGGAPAAPAAPAP